MKKLHGKQFDEDKQGNIYEFMTETTMIETTHLYSEKPEYVEGLIEHSLWLVTNDGNTKSKITDTDFAKILDVSV